MMLGYLVISETNISTGKSTKHIPLLKAVLLLATTPGSIVGLNHTTANNIIGDQAISIHNSRLLQAKRPHTGFPQRSIGIAQGVIDI